MSSGILGTCRNKYNDQEQMRKKWVFFSNMKIDRIIKIQLMEVAAIEADPNDNAMCFLFPLPSESNIKEALL